MALSASWSWTVTRDQIITRALRIIGAIEQGENPSAEQISEGSEALNALIQSYSNEMAMLWAYEWKTKTFSAASEVTGTDGLIYTCIRSHTSGTDNRPITGADYTTYWYERGSTGSVWVTPAAYSAIGDFTITTTTAGVIGIDKAFIRYNNAEYPLEIGSLPQYMDLSDKETEGTPSLLAFQNALSPKVYLYPQPDSTSMVLHYLAVKKAQDFDAASNNPDLFMKHVRALVFDLAADLAPEYGVSAEEKVYLDRKAGGLRRYVKTSDHEKTENDFVEGSYCE